MAIDWLQIASSLKDIKENLDYLKKHGGKNEDEDNLRKVLLTVDIENLRSELFNGRGNNKKI